MCTDVNLIFREALEEKVDYCRFLHSGKMEAPSKKTFQLSKKL